MPADKDARFWDRIARRYAKTPVKDMESYDLTMDRTRAHLAPDDTVLELGCGTGTTALRLADAVGRMTATDISPEMIAIADEKLADHEADNVRFEAAEIATSDAGPFDVVMGYNLLHLVDDLDAALSAIAERVRPGGLFVSKTVCLAKGGWYFRPMVKAMQWFGKAPFVGFLSIRELENRIENAGFTIIETGTFPASPPARFVVARKT